MNLRKKLALLWRDERADMQQMIMIIGMIAIPLLLIAIYFGGQYSDKLIENSGEGISASDALKKKAQ